MENQPPHLIRVSEARTVSASWFTPARRWLAAAAFGLIVVPAHAQLASTVVMQALQNPRGLAFGPSGALYVTEAGAPFTPTDSTPFLTVRGTPNYYGSTGSISRLSGEFQSRVANGLPMLFIPTTGEVAGAHGIGFSATGDLYFTIGLGADPGLRTAAMPGLGALMRLPAGGGAPQTVADVSAFEAANNPAGGPVDSNPYQLVVLSDRVLLADAGANAILQTTFGGATSLVSVLPALPGGVEPVPTGVAVGPGGSIYFTQLTGFPFPVGGASLYRLDGSAATKVAGGFTNAIDVKLGPDGLLYVIEITHNGLTSGSSTGGLWQVNPATGASTLLMTDGLTRPTALAFDGAGNLFVADRGVIPGAGQVLRFASAELAKSRQFLASRGILNASTRGRTGGGAEPMIMGFVVGTDSKQALVRGIGPGLAPFGVAAPVADPKIVVYDGAGRVVAENDNWSTAADAVTAAGSKVGAFSLPANSLDAAIVVTLAPGAYTVHLSATANTSGTALIEVYEIP